MTNPSFKLYLARHGETDYNRRRLMQGRSIDASLNEKGEAQAEALAARMADVPMDAVYTSTLMRARQTADILARSHGIEPKLLPDLAEMAWGELEGKPISEFSDYLKRVGEEWKSGRFEERIGGGETILDVESRAKAVWNHLNDSHSDGETAFVVTHGRFLRVLLTVAVPDCGLPDMDRFSHSNTGVYRLERSAGIWTLTLSNCTAHLEVVPQ